MLEGHWLLTEGAAIALPAASTALYARRARKTLRSALRAPLFWDGGQPVSLATIYVELNGEADLPAAVGEALGLPAPNSPAELARAVALLQADPAATRHLVLDLATEFSLRGTVPSAASTAADGVKLMERLTEAHGRLGFFAFMASLNVERPALLPALLPIEALLPGGLPLGQPDPGGTVDPGPLGVLGVLSAIGLARQGEWLPGVVKAVEDLLRERRVKKARDHYHRALTLLGAAAGEALRRRSPAGQQLRRNMYSPLDAYRNLATRARAQAGGRRSLREMLVPTIAQVLRQELFARLAHAMALVSDKCHALERTILGRDGHAHAGDVVFRHRESLLHGVAPDAFPLAAVQQALDDYLKARDEEATNPSEA
ncbi:MAG: hypothetical protein JWM80_2772 [Cyanobacteria bacterium RYN_339]|nr:hypothetical protein [Cyanobacteria bacterium RYN_339]